MKVCLIGHGKMGLAIERLLPTRGHEVIAVIGKQSTESLEEALSRSDIAIEFTKPDVAFHHLSSCIKLGIPVVCGTTGWLDKWDELEDFCQKHNGALVYASNFSIGVQIFFSLNRRLAAMMAGHTDYSCSVEEIHHIHKLDAPSGTALSLAKDIINRHPSYTEWKPGTKQEEGSLPISSIREDEVIGTHFVQYRSVIDEIVIKHQAFSRDGFALGAIVAAEWLLHKKGIYTMADVLGLE